MKQHINVGRTDRILRISFSFGLFYFTLIDDQFIEETIIKYFLIVIACLNIFVSSIRICPLYKIAGISTCSSNKK